MIIVLANYLAEPTATGSTRCATILGACVLVGPPLALVMLQPDLGTSLVFAAILAGMLWMSGASLKWLGGARRRAVIAMVPIAWTYILRDYQKERLTSFLNPNPDITDSGYQLYQSQIAVGSGGWFGRGLTNGTQAQGDFLPVQTTDFVFSVLAEELGFIGGLVLFVLFALLLWRVLVAGWRSRDPVRDAVRGRGGLDDPVPALRQRRDGHGHHADHRHPAAVRDPRRCLAREHRDRPRHPPEHQHPPDPRRVVTGRI